MFEREIKFITDFSLNNIKKLGSFFTLENLANARVHPAITQYISAEIDYLIYLDRQRLLQKSDFDYSGPETAKHFEAIAAEIKKNKLIPFEDVKMRVQRAVNFNVNFLLRPHWTLRKFIFDPDESRSSEEVRLLLNYSWFYEYYKQYFARVIERKKILSLSKNEFSERFIVFRKELVSSQMELFIDDALTSLAEFLNMGESIKDRLATGAVEAFLKDSDLSDHAIMLRQQLSADPKQKYSIADIKETLLSKGPVVRTMEISDEDETEAQGGNELTIDALLLESQPPVEKEDLPAIPEEEEEPAREETESELDVSLQITELLTTQLLGDDTAKSHIGDAEAPKTFDGVPAESIIAEIKAAQEAMAAVNAKSKEEPEEPSTEEEEQQVDEISEFIPDEVTDAEELESLVDADGEEPDIDLSDSDMFSTSTVSDEIGNEIEESPIHLNIPDDEEFIYEDEEPEAEDEESTEEEPAPPEEEIKEEEKPLPEKEPVQEEPATEEEPEEEEEESELFRYFTTKETMRMISALFANDQIDFVNTIERIAACSSYDQAKLILTSVFYSYRVNPLTSREAKLLEDRVQKYMEEREQ